MRVFRPAEMAFWGALLVSGGVHLPVYAVLGVLSPVLPGQRTRPSVRIPFEVTELGREESKEQRAEPVEPAAAEPAPPPAVRRPAPRVVVPPPDLSERPAEPPAQMADEPAEASAGAYAPAERASVAPLAVAAEGGTMVVAAASGKATFVPATGSKGFGSTGTGSGNGGGGGRATGGESPAVPLVRVEPRYPREAARRGVQGWVRLRFDISPGGTVDNPVVVESHPPGVFERTVFRAIRDWKYRPMIRDGVAVRRKGVQIKLTFKLDR